MDKEIDINIIKILLTENPIRYFLISFCVTFGILFAFHIYHWLSDFRETVSGIVKAIQKKIIQKIA